MSKSHYAFRLWRVWERADGEVSLTSAISQDPPGETHQDFLRWRTKTLVAECRKRPGEHPAPEDGCECGIYAYPDLLDVLRLIPNENYCASSMYAIGLVSGYGGVHNDGTVIAHDACLRFAQADIVAFAKVGAAWRRGHLAVLGNRLGVPLLSIEEMTELARGGKTPMKKQHRAAGTRYLDDILPGETAHVAVSALIADRGGKLFLRNDRQAFQNMRGDRVKVAKKADGTFHVDLIVGAAGPIETPFFQLLPFDGDADLANDKTRLAGRVDSIQIYRTSRVFLSGRADGKGAFQLPDEFHLTMLDLLRVGDRVQVGSESINFADSGRVWLNRLLRPNGSWDPWPVRLYVKAIKHERYALEIEVDKTVDTTWPYGKSRPGFKNETHATNVSFNGKSLPGGKIPSNWIRRETNQHRASFRHVVFSPDYVEDLA